MNLEAQKLFDKVAVLKKGHTIRVNPVRNIRDLHRGKPTSFEDAFPHVVSLMEMANPEELGFELAFSVETMGSGDTYVLLKRGKDVEIDYGPVTISVPKEDLTDLINMAKEVAEDFSVVATREFYNDRYVGESPSYLDRVLQTNNRMKEKIADMEKYLNPF